MSFEAEFLTMMPSTMSVYPLVSWTDYGDPLYSTTAVTYRYRGEYEPTVSHDQLGAEVITSITAYVASTSPLNPLDSYVLADGSTGVVLSVTQAWDDEGLHHNVVRFGGGG